MKLNGYIVSVVDSSDIVLFSTEENIEIDVVNKLNLKLNTVMAKVLLLYDCAHKIVLDTCIRNYEFGERKPRCLNQPKQFLDSNHYYL